MGKHRTKQDLEEEAARAEREVAAIGARLHAIGRTHARPRDWLEKRSDEATLCAFHLYRQDNHKAMILLRKLRKLLRDAEDAAHQNFAAGKTYVVTKKGIRYLPKRSY